MTYMGSVNVGITRNQVQAKHSVWRNLQYQSVSLLNIANCGIEICNKM